MRAVRKVGAGVEVVDVPMPTGDGVRVRVRAAGICGSDLHLLAHDYPVEVTLGHEFAGVTPDGTPVAIEPLQPCERCSCCLRGDYNLCERGGAMVIGNGLDGGMAEEVIVPARCLVPLPSGVSLSDASLVEPLAVAVHGLLRAGIRADRRVAVIGGGSIGLCSVAAAVASGAEVALVARHDPQREAGERLGSARLGDGYDIVVDAAGTRSALEQAVELCRPGGALALVGTYWDGFELPGIELCMKEIDVVPASIYARQGVARDIDVAAGILAANPAIGEALITHRFPLEAAPEAFRVAGERSAGAIKVVLEP